jgi:outer membrane biosynthesis protein TonB
MGEPTEIISNLSAALVTAGLTAMLLLGQPAPAAAPAGLGPNGVEMSLEMAAAEPEKPKEEPPPPAAPPPEPTPPEPTPPEPPAPPPPQPEAEEPPKPDEEPPRPVETLMDEDGEKNKFTALPTVSEEVKVQYQKCLIKFMALPNTKEIRKNRPRGTVEVVIYYSEGKLQATDVIESSGSPIIDLAARNNVKNSDCGLVAKTGSIKIRMKY